MEEENKKSENTGCSCIFGILLIAFIIFVIVAAWKIHWAFGLLLLLLFLNGKL